MCHILFVVKELTKCIHAYNVFSINLIPNQFLKYVDIKNFFFQIGVVYILNFFFFLQGMP